jgi:hypothetical protein
MSSLFLAFAASVIFAGGFTFGLLVAAWFSEKPR